MRKTDRHKNREKIFVFAHDAGGAEILAAYVRANDCRQCFHVYAAPPALEIFRREGVAAKKLTRENLENIVSAHRGGPALLGTGHLTSLEITALKEAKRQGMRTAAYIDSWTNYRERFGYPRAGWRKNLPDEIWAGDTAALQLAKRYFTATRVRYVPNQYFASIAARYRSRARATLRPRRILFMCAGGRSSEKLLAEFLAGCARRAISAVVRVRMHPANDRARYARIIRANGLGVRVELSHERNIVNDLLSARVVVGPETNALVPAFLAGIQTIRIVPKGKMTFLPFKRIIRVKSAKVAARKIDF